MKTIINNYVEKYGYTPTIFELFNLYSQGNLYLSNIQENELKLEFEKNNLN